MCTAQAPKIEKPKPLPVPPPPPVADEDRQLAVKRKNKKNEKYRRAGLSALTISRPSTRNTPMGGTGLSIPNV